MSENRSSKKAFIVLIVGWAIVLAIGVGFGSWCHPLAVRCLPLLPIWTISSIIFFGVPALAVEAVLGVVIWFTGRGRLQIIMSVPVVVLSLCFQAVVGYVLAPHLGIAGP